MRLQRLVWLFIVLIVGASIFHLRPYRFDTREVSASLIAFDNNRLVLMNVGLVRGLTLFPAVILASRLGQRFGGVSFPLFLAGSIFWGLGGVAQVLIGVPAEEYQPGTADAHAIEVIGDVLFWASENLTVLGGLGFTAAALVVSVGTWKGRSRPWWGYLGLAALPLLFTATLSFYLHRVGNPLERPWYIGFAAVALLCFVVWLACLARYSDRGDLAGTG